MLNITVRKATVEDAEAISMIGIASWKAAYAGIVPQAYLDNLSLEKKVQQIEKSIGNPRHHFLLAEADDKAVGMICFHPTYHDSPASGLWEIGAIYVIPEYWHRNVGSVLLDAAFSDMKKRNVLTCDVWVFAENDTARRFYEKKGFVLTDLKESMVIDGKSLDVVCYSIQFHFCV